jgi:hypothetical protein
MNGPGRGVDPERKIVPASSRATIGLLRHHRMVKPKVAPVAASARRATDAADAASPP